MSRIENQVRLPIRVALGVVLQGIRIRFGRSLVTILGVVLGIAFLMAMLTAQVAGQGVRHEELLRAEVRRMQNFLTAEIGPVAGRTLGLVRAGRLRPVERRLLQRLRDAGATLKADAFAGSAAVLVAGEVRPAAMDWTRRMAEARNPVLAVTRRALAESIHAGQGVAVVTLERRLRPEEARRAEQERRRGRFRSGWIIFISLLVTVIGIANAMLMSVTERFREIGTMKCLGALSAFVRQMFLMESVLIGFFGALAGALTGTAFSFVAYGMTYGFGLLAASLDFAAMAWYLLLSVAAGLALSVVAALYPAQVAARMVPATALRSEF